VDRRSFLKSAAIGAAATVPFSSLIARVSAGERRPWDATYGPLFPTLDEATGLPLLMLPEGFRYVSGGWTGDPLDSGELTPGAHDGMAAYDGGPGIVRLIRNHEVGAGTPFSTAAYDTRGGGGTTTLEFNSLTGTFLGSWDSLSGTIRNCAGGPTPWGTWLTCEETTEFPANGKPHGYVFEVPAVGLGDPTPIRDMGRFSHEALAIDPKTGCVYLTEDAGNTSGFYKFVPNEAGNMSAGGKLFMLRVAGVKTTQHNLYTGYPNGTRFWVDWVPVEQPDSEEPNMPGNFVWAQGRAQGAATFGRLEGAWYANFGGASKIYFVSTNGGAVGQGQVWEYSPGKEYIRLVFESPSSATLNAPDNITVSPRGGLVLCEDGGGEEFLHGLTVDGTIFPFAKNTLVLPERRNSRINAGNYAGSEWAGACYSPDGKWLFANIQSPGVTFAITGPWQAGAL
jgi:secreted PhoX family phosphatase